MAQRRMFSTEIVASDAFLDMPVSARELYFQLGMYADDDGFVNPRKIIRMAGASEDDLKILIAKRFILSFKTGVIVIKHWLQNNLIRSDLYRETNYKNEKNLLGLNENGSYTELREGVANIKAIRLPAWVKKRRGKTVRKRTASVPFAVPRIGKDRIGKVSKEKDTLYNEELTKILIHWNLQRGEKRTSYQIIKDNFIYWREIYTLDQILEAIESSKKDKQFLGVISLETFFRKKNKNGENVDYIAAAINFKESEEGGVLVIRE